MKINIVKSTTSFDFKFGLFSPSIEIKALQCENHFQQMESGPDETVEGACASDAGEIRKPGTSMPFSMLLRNLPKKKQHFALIKQISRWTFHTVIFRLCSLQICSPREWQRNLVYFWTSPESDGFRWTSLYCYFPLISTYKKSAEEKWEKWNSVNYGWEEASSIDCHTRCEFRVNVQRMRRFVEKPAKKIGEEARMKATDKLDH